MVITGELLKRLIGKHVNVQDHPGGFIIKESKGKGEYVITDAGDQFIEAKASSLNKRSKYYFNICSILSIILLE